MKPCRKCGGIERYAPRKPGAKLGACKACARARAMKPGLDALRAKNERYRNENRDRYREIVRKAHAKFRKNNRDKMNEKSSKERAIKRNAVPKWFGEFDDLVCKEAFSLAKVRELETGIKWDVDHIVPLSCKIACGLHCAENLRVIPAAINRSRKNSYEG